ncbi:MAG: DUF4259 domain-containing protein [Myxococcota bacterium]|nr:DUF4259 domain-containing protein [Myxococcota bacterium]
MGVWGPGNLEEDTAEEHLNWLLQPLLQQIAETAGNPTAMEPDEYDSVAMMCNIEIIACLAEGIGTNADEGRLHLPVAMPSVQTVRTWRSAYLEVWDDHIVKLGASDQHREQRRAVIVRTFERLERVAAFAEGK